ncbi:MAG: CDP-alcohol phosphatidyltransferase family protein [Proteobacteria bacterium]|nr:CDP-alcohol phosphatidyltransferase family protein [Pseudomonadota bacterium]
MQHLPNIITFGRIFSIIPLVWFMLLENYLLALYIAIAAGISDGLDGYLAKKYGWEGWLGSILDPLADKFMMLSCYLVFTIQNILPAWLFLIILIRDVVIIIGATMFHFLLGKINMAKPSAVSKYTTAFQILLILVILIDLSVFEFDQLILDGLIGLVVFLTVVSGLHYMITWGMKANKMIQEKK